MLIDYINDCLLFSERGQAKFKSAPADFIVEEILDWQFSGEGEHLFLWVEKTNSNTQWVARQLAKFYQVPVRDVGYAGLKDRQAITRQYFSIRLPKLDALTFPQHEDFQVLHHHWHHKKLKRGFHQGNRFSITLQDAHFDATNLATQIEFIKTHGMPNLFDSQRFGHDNANLQALLDWQTGVRIPRKRDDISLLLSALRSLGFNAILAERIKQQNWFTGLAGDVMQLDGSGSVFNCEEIDETISSRLQSFDIHPTGCLLGEGELGTSDLAKQLEITKIENYLIDFKDVLSKNRVAMGRRPLRVKVADLTLKIEPNNRLQFDFQLPTGSYASALLKQFFNF